MKNRPHFRPFAAKKRRAVCDLVKKGVRPPLRVAFAAQLTVRVGACEGTQERMRHAGLKRGEASPRRANACMSSSARSRAEGPAMSSRELQPSARGRLRAAALKCDFAPTTTKKRGSERHALARDTGTRPEACGAPVSIDAGLREREASARRRLGRRICPPARCAAARKTTAPRSRRPDANHFSPRNQLLSTPPRATPRRAGRCGGSGASYRHR